MTKEEYERLLQSDYWKGYSYSLIKERNFTCADCGRRFPNERNKLQVHHLVYRDINPWSYSPEEVVVLCKECHLRRHGLLPKTESVNELITPETNGYTRSYSSEYNTSEKTVRPKDYQRIPNHLPKKKRKWNRIFITACFFAAILFFTMPDRKKIDDNKLSSDSSQEVITINQKNSRNASPAVVRQQTKTNNDASAKPLSIPEDAVSNSLTEEPWETDVEASIPSPDLESSDQQSTTEIFDEHTYNNVVKQAQRAGLSTEGTTSEIIDRITHANIVKQAQQAGVSTEGTTSEIIDRINHASAVKQAQKAGVSTEGTTSEILDRINHASVVKQAQRTGVSTEGTTSEILDRINHAGVVKQAQRAGVSTEGTTSEILERINHASVVKQAQRAGVSTEGTTSEILERINHASVVKQAQRAGVSTEGTTSEILDRITKKNLENLGH